MQSLGPHPNAYPLGRRAIRGWADTLETGLHFRSRLEEQPVTQLPWLQLAAWVVRCRQPSAESETRAVCTGRRSSSSLMTRHALRSFQDNFGQKTYIKQCLTKKSELSTVVVSHNAR